MADFDTCWRSTEAVEASHTPQVNSNQLYLSHIFQDFFHEKKKINVPFGCLKPGSDVKYISNILEAINEKLNCSDGLKVRKKGNFRKAAGIEEQKC